MPQQISIISISSNVIEPNKTFDAPSANRTEHRRCINNRHEPSNASSIFVCISIGLRGISHDIFVNAGEWVTVSVCTGRKRWVYDISFSDTSPRHFDRTDNFPLHLGHLAPAVEAKIWKLALTHTPDLNRPTIDAGDFFWKLALIHISDPNWPTTRGPDSNSSTTWVIFWKLAVLLTLTDLHLSILYTLTVDRSIL